MIISFGDQRAEFRPWRPEMGRILASGFAFDSETTPIDPARPWIAPDYVLGAAFDGQQGYFIRREHVADFFMIHRDLQVVLHNAPFDLGVLHKLAPQIDVYGWVDRHGVWDTRLLHRLYVLATEGHTAGGSGESTLEHCVERHLGLSLPKDTVDAVGDPIRTSWGKWLGRSPQEIEPAYLEYLARDVVATWLVHRRLVELIGRQLAVSTNAFGYVDEDWLTEQVRRWGPLTHHVQLKAAIVLETVSAAGLHVDVERCGELTRASRAECQSALETLSRFGWQPGPGSGGQIQQILAEIQVRHPEQLIPRTDGGLFTTSVKELRGLDLAEPFIEAYTAYARAKKRLEFLEKMNRDVLHPRFDPLKVTGRTSSSGDLNAQNLPRDDAIRSCFVPSPGHVFVDADYKAIELATLAQACVRQFGWPSRMADAINRGEDLHTIVAARVADKPVDQITREERQRAKAVNFGKPGGLGDAALKQLAADNYDVHLTDAEVHELSEVWLDFFPEMRTFLGAANEDPGLAVAKTLCLTPQAHYEHTGEEWRRFQQDLYGCADQPDRMLGWMALRAFKEAQPVSRTGRPYSAETIDFFWSRLQAAVDLVPMQYRSAIMQRQPSPQLRRAVQTAVERHGVFTLTGRLRADASYTQRHNTIFQGLAADGAKLALWSLWRAGYRIVNFVHDEVLIEVPAEADLAAETQHIREILVAGMRAVVPDVRIDVEISTGTNWAKGGAGHVPAPAASAGPPLPPAGLAVHAA